MDKILDSFSSKTTAQKSVIVIVATILFIAVLVVLYFVTTPTTSSPSLGNSNKSKNSPIPTGNTVSSGNQIGSNNWVPYKNSDYQINYPSSFSYQEGTIRGGGTSLTIKPQGQNPSNMIIEIQSYDPSIASQSAVENVFSALGYQKSQTFVDNIPATEFTGSISGEGVPLREIAIIFNYGGKVYKFQLSYSSQNRDNSVEQLFNNIVLGFKPSS